MKVKDAICKPVTLTYHTFIAHDRTYDLKADIYLPPPGDDNVPDTEQDKVPIVVYFHAGGLTAGSRQLNPWFPHWLIRDCLDAGFAFITVDYSLLRPATGFHILNDVKQCFRWIERDLNRQLEQVSLSSLEKLQTVPHLSTSRIAVVGESAGGYLALLAAMHATPKPKALISLYGMGGNFLSDHYVHPKTSQFSVWVPYITDDTPYKLLENNQSSEKIVVHSSTDDDDPRVSYFTWLVQEAKFLDALTGRHDLTYDLRLLSSRKREEYIDSDPSLRQLFPQVCIDPDFPPTLLIHGDADTAVLVEESRNLASVLSRSGIEHTYIELKGLEHGFDWGSPTAPRHISLGQVAQFLLMKLQV